MMMPLSVEDKKKMKFEFSLKNWRDIPSRENPLLNMESLHLYRWYVTTYEISSLRGYFPISCSNPYHRGNTIEDVDFYFRWKGMHFWRSYTARVCRCSTIDIMTNDGTDADILAEHYGYIPLRIVPKDYSNVVRCVLGGRYDMAMKYMKRGDAKGHMNDVRLHLSIGQYSDFMVNEELMEAFFSRST